MCCGDLVSLFKAKSITVKLHPINSVKNPCGHKPHATPYQQCKEPVWTQATCYTLSTVWRTRVDTSHMLHWPERELLQSWTEKTEFINQMTIRWVLVCTQNGLFHLISVTPPPPPPMDDFSVCPRRYLHAKIFPYSLANFSEISVIHCKLLPVLEVSSQNFYRQIALSSTELKGDTLFKWDNLIPSLSLFTGHHRTETENS